MPWSLLIRLLSGFVFWRLLGNRRRTAAQRAFGSATARNPAVAQRVRDARDAATLLSRLVVATTFGIATALCLAGGTSSVVLSPRWLGGVLLAMGVLFAMLTIREARLARRLVAMRRLRRRDNRLREEV
ncbi:MAG: hypothetical protein JF886_02450 [Candidatus Dormibacteraeota bacterium]|uniref:Uncharacterized protein n=1 Tax=Candidatus Aeolococcus gillhamiae TaxID=3127015 RepID=A0A934K0P6_9BACT|nr:hypothetical protein [Candidatus Dormibacteraeota bacterium]